MSQEKIYSVYMHINKINNKRYIGITRNLPEKRWGKNGINYKNNKFFYNAINKYGWDNFEHIIILKNLNKQEAENKEISLIKEYNATNRDTGYNIESGGNSTGKINNETKTKMSLSHKGKGVGKANSNYGNRGFDNSCSKQIICINAKEVFGSFRDIERKYNISPANIWSVCQGKKVSAGKHLITGEPLQWDYYDKNKQYQLKEYSDAKGVPKKVMCLNNNTKYETLTQAAKDLKLDVGSISKVCHGKASHTHGYIFKFANNIAS